LHTGFVLFGIGSAWITTGKEGQNLVVGIVGSDTKVWWTTVVDDESPFHLFITLMDVMPDRIVSWDWSREGTCV